VTAVDLRLESVSRRFGAVEAVRSLSLHVPAGGFAALLGPSGCGKTTILRLLGGLDRPTDGGLVFTPRPERISMCFQSPRLLPWLTVRDNIALPLRLQRVDQKTRQMRADALIEQVGLGGFGAHRPHQLSGGMQMRVAVARALITEPQLLLLDEPFGALDEITRGQLDDLLLDIWRTRGMTVVLVTHSIDEAIYLAQTVHVLAPRPGRLVRSIPVRLSHRTQATRVDAAFTTLVAQAYAALAEGMTE
jgi:NitT/TauT family transport system ATP-binding protein